MVNKYTEWLSILKSIKIPELYYNDIFIILNRIDKLNNDDSICGYNDKQILFTITLKVLSKIDLSKVEFVTNKNKCDKFTFNVQLNKNDYMGFGIDIEAILLSTFSNEIIKYINDCINTTGGVFIYSIVDSFNEISDITMSNTTYNFRSCLSSFNNRYNKIIKLNEKLDKQRLLSL